MTLTNHADHTPVTLAAKTTQVDNRVRWQGHIAAAIIDLRNSDRSPYEQMVYDFLRGLQLPPHK